MRLGETFGFISHLLYYLNISDEKSGGDDVFLPHLHEYLAFYISTG